MRFKYYLRGAGIGVIVATLVLSIAFLFHDDISDEEVIRRAMKLGMVMQENGSGTLSDIAAPDASKADLETTADTQGSTKTDEDPLGQAGDTDPSLDDPDASGSDSDTQTDPDDQSPDDQTSAADDPAGEDDQLSDTNTDKDKNHADDSSSGDGKQERDPSDNKDNHKNEKDNADDQPPKQPSDPKPDDAENTSDEVEIVIESGDVSRKVSAKVFEAGLVDDAAEFNAFLGANDYDNMLQPGTYKIKKGSSFREIARILTRQ